MDTSQFKPSSTNLPGEVKVYILRYLGIEDLCHMAMCNRSWREAANYNPLWRPLCRKKGWERYGTICDLCEELSFRPTLQDQTTGEGGAPTFPADAVVKGSDWPGLVATCKWKEVYMKARHLEENWSTKRYYSVSLKFQTAVHGYDEYGAIFPNRRQFICNLACEGDCLAVGAKNGVLKTWDLSIGKIRHSIPAYISEAPNALKMKDGIIAVGCKDGKIRTYSAQTGEQLQVMSGHRRLPVTHLFFDGDTIVSVALPQRYRKKVDHDIRVWSAANGASLYVLQCGNKSTALKDLDYKDKMVAGAYSDRKIRIWDVRSGYCMQQIVCDSNKLISCHLGDGIVIGTFQDLIVKTWELESGECMKTFVVQSSAENHRPLSLAGCKFNGDMLAVLLNCRTPTPFLTVVDLDGKHIGSFSSVTSHAIICFQGKKLVTWNNLDRKISKHELWIIDPKNVDNSTGGSVQTREADCLMNGNPKDQVCLSDTKVVCVQRMNQKLNTVHVLAVRHYW